MSSVSASSGAPLAAAAPAKPSLKDMRSWDVEGVKLWAMAVDGIAVVYADILVAQEIDGAALLDVVTEEKLIKMYGMPGGPAGKLMNAVAAIKKVGGTVPTDSGAGSAVAGAGACGWGGG